MIKLKYETVMRHGVVYATSRQIILVYEWNITLMLGISNRCCTICNLCYIDIKKENHEARLIVEVLEGLRLLLFYPIFMCAAKEKVDVAQRWISS